MGILFVWLLPLPYDWHRLSDEHRTECGISVSFYFSQDLSHHLLIYALLKNIRPDHLGIVIYYPFLFKLNNEENELNIDDWYWNELKSIIELFENTIPLRYQLDFHWSSRSIDQICLWDSNKFYLIFLFFSWT